MSVLTRAEHSQYSSVTLLGDASTIFACMISAVLTISERLDAGQNQLAADELALGEPLDLDDGNHLVELLFELLDDVLVAVGDDRDAGDVGVARHADREGIDIEAAAREQSRNLGEYARVVFNENG